MLFDWDWHNAKHVREKGIEPDEVEHAVLDPDRIGASAHNIGGERRNAMLGGTASGRTPA